MNAKIDSAFKQIEKRTKIDLMMTRINVVISYADENNMLDDFLDSLDASISRALYSIENMKENNEQFE